MRPRCPDCNAADLGSEQIHEASCPAWNTTLDAYEADRAWLDAHPDLATTGRHRPITESEKQLVRDHPRGADVTHVWVSLVEPSSAMRRYAPCWACARHTDGEPS